MRNLTMAGNPAEILIWLQRNSDLTFCCDTNMLVVCGYWAVVILRPDPDMKPANSEVMALPWLQSNRWHNNYHSDVQCE
jgi:hypothetical protein